MDTKKKEAASDALAWVLLLPEEGGAWGLGVTSTVKSIEAEMGRLEAQRIVIDEQLKARKKLLRQTVKRAEKEAPLLFDSRAIDSAMLEVAELFNEPPAGD